MKKNSLASTGLSMSQAQTISNLCNQSVREYLSVIGQINNCSKTLEFGGKSYTKQQGCPMPITIIDQIQDIGRYSACQAFLMENIKAKEAMLTSLKSARFASEIEAPVCGDMQYFTNIPAVSEEWGWEQLSSKEVCEYLEAEAMAAHIGNFIHKDMKLDRLRKELPTIATLEWHEISPKTGETVPVTVTIHNTKEDLFEVHEHLAGIHREHEQKVNYFKAKVKNLVTAENARIAQENGSKQAEINKANDSISDQYNAEVKKWRDAIKVEQQEWEQARQKEIQRVAALRIEIYPAFQTVIDEFLPKKLRTPEDLS